VPPTPAPGGPEARGVELVHVGSVACWIVVILTGHATSVEREQGF
jgi:hypothetical protein